MNGVQEENERRSKKLSTTVRHQDLHDRLLDAAEAAILTGGLGNLRARALAETVGCSVGAIYGVFPDLDALIVAVNGRTLEAVDAAMRRAANGQDAAAELGRLACAYLDYAAANQNRWRALFEHRMPQGQAIPDWYAERQAVTFSHIEAPLAVLQPRLKARALAVLARTVFAAVHGMVDLGLQEKVAVMPVTLLRTQVRLVVAALAVGLEESK